MLLLPKSLRMLSLSLSRVCVCVSVSVFVCVGEYVCVLKVELWKEADWIASTPTLLTQNHFSVDN